MDRDIHREVDEVRDEPAGTPSIGGPNRRAILLGVGGVGTAVALAACGAGTSSAGSGDGGTVGDGGTSGDGGDGGSTGGQASNDLGATSAIPVGGGKVFPQQLVVVTQPTAGAFKAFTAVCTHEGCTVNRVEDGLIICPCHQSAYSITNGAVKQGPAPTPLASKQITVANGQITLD